MKHLILRADATSEMGIGHLMRCIALAQAWHDAGGVANFAAVNMPGRLATRLISEGMAWHQLDVDPGSDEDAAQTSILAQEIGAAWVVEDGYHFGTKHQSAIKKASLCLLAIDDQGHAGHYVADLVLNQNICADASLYTSRERTTRLLLGSSYVLLRREFLRWRGWKRQISERARKVLVTMGGADPDNVTLKVIKALKQVRLPGLEAKIVVGPANPNLRTLAQEAGSQPNFEIATSVSDMPELMARADLAVSAGGSTCWELAYMGVPSLVIILAENQEPVARGLDEKKVAICCGWHDFLSPDQLAESIERIASDVDLQKSCSESGRELVDGLGAKRVINAMEAS